MRSVYFHWPTSMGAGYPKILLRQLAEQAGMEVVDHPAKAEAVLVSLCDVSELHHLVAARKFGRPVIAGGWISYMPFLRHFADLVCVGEGYNFMRELGRARSLRDMEGLPYVSTPAKQGVIDEHIDWDVNPIARVGGNACYYYCGKGCPTKCKFCAMAYSRHVQYADFGYIERAAEATPSNGHLFLMVSYLPYKLPQAIEQRLGATDVRIKDYIRRPVKARQVRAGVEFLSAQLRRDLAKPLTEDHIAEFFRVTKAQKTEATLYFIGGLETVDDAEAFIGCLPVDMDLGPRVHLHFTYLDPQPLTPMADFDIRQKVAFDGVRFMALCHTRNRRVRVGTLRQPGYSTWRTLQQRAETAEEAAWAYSLRTCSDHERLVGLADQHHPRLLGVSSLDDIRGRKRRIDESAFLEAS